MRLARHVSVRTAGSLLVELEDLERQQRRPQPAHSAGITVHVPRGRIPLAIERIGAGNYGFGSPLRLASSLGASCYRSRRR